MKRYKTKKTYSLIPLCFFLIVRIANSQQWSGSANTQGAITRDGNVTVGANIPSTLDVYGNLHLGLSHPGTQSSFIFRGPNSPAGIDSKRQISFEFLAAGKAQIRSYRGGNWDTYLQFLTSSYLSGIPDVRLHINGDGNVGVGTVEPMYKLDINGTGRLTQNLTFTGPNAPAGEGSNRMISFEFTAAGKSGIRSYRGGNLDTYLQLLTSSYNNGDAAVRMHIDGDGNVGIGTTTPESGYKLSVNGSIRAKEIKVNTGWSDFVFFDSYKLRPLAEVETFIQQNKHLPDVPSAAEVEKEGVSLGEMDAILLRKIEELTLYVIELKKEIADLKKVN